MHRDIQGATKTSVNIDICFGVMLSTRMVHIYVDSEPYLVLFQWSCL